jgi:hypothetical protein
MPAPRPVLIDLHERGLDPRHHHTQLDNGRLASPVKHEVVDQPRSALVALPVNQPSDDDNSEEIIDASPQQVATSNTPEIVVVASSKKNKKVKTDKLAE